MIKFVVAALWLCAVTVAATVYSFQSGQASTSDETKPSPAALLGGLDYMKTDVLSVPVLRDSGIAGYFLARLVYTIEPARLAKLSVPADSLVVDEVYSYLFGNPQIDFTDHEAIDIDAFRNGIRDSINARVGEKLVHDVMVEQVDFLTKDEIRDNTLRRRSAAPADKPKGNKVFHH